MQPSSSRANRFYLLASILLLVLGVMVLLQMGKSPASTDAVADQKHTAASDTHPANASSDGESSSHPTKRPRSTLRKPPTPEQINQCYENITEELKKDESTRAVLVSENKAPSGYHSKFTITARHDFQAYLDQLIADEAKRAKIDQAAILQDVDRMQKLVRNYEIAPGDTKTVHITVPYNSSDHITAMVMVGPPSGTQKLSTLTVGVGKKSWRYDYLIQPDEEEQK